MQVVLNGVKSRTTGVLSGVPQGSVLGPTLFLLFINHVLNGLEVEYAIFADDIKLYIAASRNKYTDSVVMQEALNTVYERSRSWGLDFSVTKCSVLHFSRRYLEPPPIKTYYLGGSPIQYCEEQRDLGILIDSSLKFHIHN